MQKINLYVPEINDYISMLLKTGFFNCIVYADDPIVIDGIVLETKKMNHPVKTYSFKISIDGKTFVYTGDTNICPQVEELFLVADAILCDTAFLHENWNEKLPHMS